MDWDDVRTPSGKAVTTGESLATASIAELEARITALMAEIDRVRAEIDQKRRQADAANAMFKS